MRLILFVLILIVFGCSHKGSPYFRYDEIVLYKSEISSAEVTSLYNNVKTKDDSIKKGLVSEYIPQNITDTLFLSKIEKLGYKASKINSKDFPAIDNIFMSKSYDDSYTTSCENEFRNILVFKKKNKTIGIAKICFQCSKSYIVGTKENTEQFGMDGDYQKLERILLRQPSANTR